MSSIDSIKRLCYYDGLEDLNAQLAKAQASVSFLGTCQLSIPELTGVIKIREVAELIIDLGTHQPNLRLTSIQARKSGVEVSDKLLNLYKEAMATEVNFLTRFFRWIQYGTTELAIHYPFSDYPFAIKNYNRALKKALFGLHITRNELPLPVRENDSLLDTYIENNLIGMITTY